jgi:pimeloyl-ACP methyl ester carboxylesterase
MTTTAAPPGPGRAGRESSRRRPRRRLLVAGAAFLFAVVTASAGLGLALPHLTKEGAGGIALFGIAALAAGGLVAAWCGWRILSGLRRRWWLLALPVLLITTYLALWTVGQGVAAAVPARPALGSRTPADVGLRYDDVTLATSDGVTLAAWWVPSGNGAAVVLLHGAGSTRTAVLDHAAVLARHGYGVLLLDARGHGGSEGRGMDFGWYGERDAAAAVDFLAGRPQVAPERIGLVGLSMGGEEAVGAAGADARVRAVVAEGATNRVAADKGYLAAYGVRGHVQRGIDEMTYVVADVLSAAPEPRPLRESVAAAQEDGTPTPMLLVAAGDVETEPLAAAYLAEAAPAAVRVWTVPGAGHTHGLRTSPGDWERRVVSFLDEALAAPPIELGQEVDRP